MWFVERSGESWSAPRPLGTPFNTPYNEHSPTADAAGTICFNSSRPGSEENDIYCGRVGASLPPERQTTLNSAAEDATPWLSADGNVIVFTSNRSGGLGGWDVYVSHKGDGGWSAPRNLAAPINSSADELAVSLSLSGDYLYFFRPADASGPRRGYRVTFTGSAPTVAAEMSTCRQSKTFMLSMSSMVHDPTRPMPRPRAQKSSPPTARTTTTIRHSWRESVNEIGRGL